MEQANLEDGEDVKGEESLGDGEVKLGEGEEREGEW